MSSPNTPFTTPPEDPILDPFAPAIADATDDETAFTTAEDETITRLITELTEARKAADEAQDRALRAQSELQNFRRRKERETSERIEQANVRLLRELLPVVDDFERAFANVPVGLVVEEQSWVYGFGLILRKLQILLEREGVTIIPAAGAFDPTLHEAISSEPHDAIPSGDIIAEVERGYRLHDKILRPSRVRVAQ